MPVCFCHCATFSFTRRPRVPTMVFALGPLGDSCCQRMLSAALFGSVPESSMTAVLAIAADAASQIMMNARSEGLRMTATTGRPYGAVSVYSTRPV